MKRRFDWLNWQIKYGGWTVAVLIICVLVTILVTKPPPSPERVQMAKTMAAELQTVTEGDLIQVSGSWEIVRNNLDKEIIITRRLDDHSSYERRIGRMSWIVGRIVRQSDTNNYSAVCVDIVKRGLR